MKGLRVQCLFLLSVPGRDFEGGRLGLSGIPLKYRERGSQSSIKSHRLSVQSPEVTLAEGGARRRLRFRAEVQGLWKVG